MKKILSLALVLLMALSCLGAHAEANLPGNWELTQASVEGLVMSASDLGISMTIVLNEDGSADLIANMAGEESSDEGSWTVSGSVVTITDSLGDAQDCAYENGRLIIEQDGVTMYLDKDGILPPDAEPSMDLAALLGELEETTADSPAGDWIITQVSTEGVLMNAADIGMNLAFTLYDDGTVDMEMTYGGTTQYDTGTWTMMDNNITMVDSTGAEQVVTLEDGRMLMEDGSGSIIYLDKDGILPEGAPEAMNLSGITEEAADSDLITYTSQDQGYSISYPADWYPMTEEFMGALVEAMASADMESIDSATIQSSMEQATAQGIHMVYMPDFSTNFNILGTPMGMNADTATLQATAPGIIAQLQATFGETFTQLEAEPVVTFGENEYVQMVYSYEMGGSKIHCTQYMISFNNTLYMVTVTSTPNEDGTTTLDPYAEDMEAVLASLCPAE